MLTNVLILISYHIRDLHNSTTLILLIILHPAKVPEDYNPFDSFVIPVDWLEYPPSIALKTSTAKMSTPKKSSSKKTP